MPSPSTLQAPALGAGSHLGWLWDQEAQWPAVLAPEIAGGVQAHERVLCLVAADERPRWLAWLEDTDLDVPALTQSGQLSFAAPREFYLSSGVFDPEACLQALDAAITAAVADGYAGLRVIADMSWALQGFPGTELLAAYEHRASQLLVSRPCRALCIYDRRHFPTGLLLQLVEAHPELIIGVEHCANPYYLPEAPDGVTNAARALDQRLANLVEHKYENREMRRTADFLRAVLDTAPVLIAVLDAEGRVLQSNRAAEAAAGAPHSGIGGRPFIDTFVTGAEAEALRELLAAAGAQPDHRLDFSAHDGRGRLIDWELMVQTGAQGEVQWLLAVGTDVTEQQAMEQALRQSEETARALLDGTPDAIFLLDAEARVLAVNDAAARRFRFTPAQLVGKTMFEFLPEPTAHTRWEHITEALRTGRPTFFEDTREGMYLETRVCPILDDQGKATRAAVYTRDVTEKKRAEDQIVHLNSVLKAIRNVSQLITRERNEERLLGACCEALIEGRGYASAWLVLADATGQLDVVHARGLGEKLPRLRRMVSRQLLPPCAQGVIAQPGVLVWITGGAGCGSCELAGDKACPVHMTVRLAHEDEVYGLLSVCLPGGMQATAEEQELLGELAGDIGLGLRTLRLASAEQTAQHNLALERDRLEALLRLTQMSEASLQELVDFALEESVRLTSSKIGYIAFASEDETILTMYSWSRTAMAQCAIVDKPIVYPVAETGLWGEAIRQRQPVITNDYTAPNPLKKGYPKGHVHVLRHMNLPVFDGSTIVAVAGVGNKESDYDEADVRQLTLLMNGLWRHIQRRQAEEQLRQLNEELEHRVAERTHELQRSNEQLEQFAYVASHDLQEPLRMVSSYVQLLEQRYRGQLDSDADDFIEFAVDGANRMGALIQDLLSYSRVGTQTREFEAVDLNAALGQALGNLARALEDSEALVTHDPLPTVLGDAPQLVQLLQNLVSNALKFRGEAPPRVHLAAQEHAEGWLISVRDNGIGLDMAYADRIFIVFQRLHAQGEYPGTGIGLAICQKIVERHGGRIWVQSTPGEGATFSFTIPRPEEAGDVQLG